MTPPDITALLASRICHDLVSPVGAVQNGLDLLAEMLPPGMEEEMALIRQSANRATDLLKLYRIAFGAADADASVPMQGLADQIAAVVHNGRTSWSWTGAPVTEIPRPLARLLALMSICAKGSIQMGGTVSAGMGAENGVTVVASGDRSSLTDAQGALVDGEGSDAGPRDVEYALLRDWAAAAGYRIQTSRGASGLRMEARPL